jgi:hypothetical protein
MKRSPLQRKTALTSSTPLRSKAPLKAKRGLTTRQRLRPRSKKMEEIYKERRPFVERFLSENPKCQVHWDENCFEWSKDVHEIKPRSAGGKIVGGDDKEYLAVCRYCHTMIDLHPQEAHDRGYRKWSWEE